MNIDKKILVCGIGALGGVLSYRLIKEGYDCHLVTHNDEITDAVMKNGLIVDDKPLLLPSRSQVQTNLPMNEEFDYIFLMMKTQAVRNTVIQIKENNLLKNSSLFITVQNGDIFPYIADVVPDQIISSLIGWSARMINPGVYKITNIGRTIIGDRTHKINLEEIYTILEKGTPGQVVISRNILGVVWSKLCISCAINAISGISGLLIGEFPDYPNGSDLYLAVYSETVDIANLQNIKLEKIVSDPYFLYVSKNTNFIKRSIKKFLLKKGLKRNGLVKTSTLQDIERGKLTEIDYLNGYVSKKGVELNHPTPVNDTLTAMIKSIEKGELKPSVENLVAIKVR